MMGLRTRVSDLHLPGCPQSLVYEVANLREGLLA
jgi:hypothetical protein